MMDDKIKNFNLRVYGLLIHEGKVLITDEHRVGMVMTKFPGGGLEKGEGLKTCLMREFQEELSIDISVDEFFYVNDFLQVSAFSPNDQLLSFYYRVSTNMLNQIVITDSEKGLRLGSQVFRWVALSDLDQRYFTFPIDKVVCDLLKV